MSARVGGGSARIGVVVVVATAVVVSAVVVSAVVVSAVVVSAVVVSAVVAGAEVVAAARAAPAAGGIVGAAPAVVAGAVVVTGAVVVAGAVVVTGAGGREDASAKPIRILVPAASPPWSASSRTTSAVSAPCQDGAAPADAGVVVWPSTRRAPQSASGISWLAAGAATGCPRTTRLVIPESETSPAVPAELTDARTTSAVISPPNSERPVISLTAAAVPSGGLAVTNPEAVAAEMIEPSSGYANGTGSAAAVGGAAS